jgi:hypothetical protein
MIGSIQILRSKRSSREMAVVKKRKRRRKRRRRRRTMMKKRKYHRQCLSQDPGEKPVDYLTGPKCGNGI